MKCNVHYTFQCVIYNCYTCSDTGMPGAILSCDVVATHGHNCVTNKQLEAKIWNLKLS